MIDVPRILLKQNPEYARMRHNEQNRAYYKKHCKAINAKKAEKYMEKFGKK